MLNATLMAIIVITFFAGRSVGKLLNHRDQKKNNAISYEINKIIKTSFAEQVSPHRDISIANELILLLREHK